MSGKKEILIKGEDHTGVCVVYMCHDGNGNFIMAKRSENARDEQGRWDIGGGGVEFGELVEDTLRKEILEEYCTNVLEHQFLGFRDVHRENNGNKTHWIALDYLVHVNPNTVEIGEPHKFDAIDWFTIENIPEDSHSQFPKFLELYKDAIKELL